MCVSGNFGKFQHLNAILKHAYFIRHYSWILGLEKSDLFFIALC
jgi:hypothetical protein